MKFNKELVYDSRIFPLMEQIISICKETGIAMVASFFIPTEKEPDLLCTSFVKDENGESGPAHAWCVALLKGEGG